MPTFTFACVGIMNTADSVKISVKQLPYSLLQKAFPCEKTLCKDGESVNSPHLNMQ